MPVILTYNVNGIRAALRKDFLSWIRYVDADIICLQEIKANPDQFDESVFINMGYECFWHSAKKKGYSGVGILSRNNPLHVEYGCGIQNIDDEGRVIRLDFENYSIMSLYFPSGSSGDHRQKFKMYFLSEFQDYITRIREQKPNLILSGDYNICHKEIDIHNPIRNKNSSGFLPEEREWVTDFLANGFIDAFRYINESPDHYTWWSYRANARAKNLGWRIDYHMISEELVPRLRSCRILSEAQHSDHCPVLLDISD